MTNGNEVFRHLVSIRGIWLELNYGDGAKVWSVYLSSTFINLVSCAMFDVVTNSSVCVQHKMTHTYEEQMDECERTDKNRATEKWIWKRHLRITTFMVSHIAEECVCVCVIELNKLLTQTLWGAPFKLKMMAKIQAHILSTSCMRSTHSKSWTSKWPHHRDINHSIASALHI